MLFIKSTKKRMSDFEIKQKWGIPNIQALFSNTGVPAKSIYASLWRYT